VFLKTCPLGVGLFRQLWKISWLSSGSVFLAHIVDAIFVQYFLQTTKNHTQLQIREGFRELIAFIIA